MAEKNEPNWMKFAGFGFEIGGGIALGALLGWYIGGRLGSASWGLIAGALLGCFAGMYLMIKEVIDMNKD